MVRILKRHRPRHTGHSLASNKDSLPMKPAVPASVYVSSEWKRWGNEYGTLRYQDSAASSEKLMILGILFWILFFLIPVTRSLRKDQGLSRNSLKPPLILFYKTFSILSEVVKSLKWIARHFLYLTTIAYSTQCNIVLISWFTRPRTIQELLWQTSWWDFGAQNNSRILGEIWN